MNESDKYLSEMPTDEMDLGRVLLSEGLAYLGFHREERVAILLVLKKKEELAEMLWWLRENIERKPTREEVIEQFLIVAEPYRVTF